MEIRLVDSQKLLQNEVKAFVNPPRLEQKKSLIFIQGEVFFLLTLPLMGDPIFSLRDFYYLLTIGGLISVRCFISCQLLQMPWIVEKPIVNFL